MRWRSAGERGAVSAEFAVALPAVVLVLALTLGAVQVGSVRIRLQDAVADTARSLGRGESLESVAARAARQVPGARLELLGERDGVLCVRLVASSAPPLAIAVDAASCALTGGG